MTFPVNQTSLWRSAIGQAAHTQNVETIFNTGFFSRFREEFLYIDSVPVVRQPSAVTKATSRAQADIFSCAFERVVASGCKFIIMRHPTNRVWFMKEMIRLGCQSIYDLSTLYQSLYGSSLNAVYVMNFAGVENDNREVIFTAHPSAIGHRRISRIEWNVYGESFLLTSRVAADAHGETFETRTAREALSTFLDNRTGITQDLMTAKLGGLKAWRRQELDSGTIFTLQDLPAIIQSEIRSRLRPLPTSNSVSLLHLTLSAMATSLAGVHGLAAIEAMTEQHQNLEHQAALAAALNSRRYQSEFEEHGVNTFSALRPEKLKLSCISNTRFDGPAWQSVRAMKRTSMRRWCKVCRIRGIFAPIEGL